MASKFRESSFSGNTNTDEYDNSDSDFRYLIVRPENGGIKDLFLLQRFLESSDEEVIGEMASECRWVIVVSIIIRKVLGFLRKPMELIGYVVEFFLNLLSLNDNLLGLICNILRGEVVMPQRGSDTFISTIGHLDGRIDLLNEGLFEGISVSVSEGIDFRDETVNRAFMDICIMASKLAYENEKVIRNIVLHHWKMHFVGFYNCWNDFQRESSTQVFIMCDKPEDANLIFISFRGTEPFDADDWSTDFDYSWYEIPTVGKIHMGFLEALGLGNRIDANSFKNHLQTEVGINAAASNGTNNSINPNGHTRTTLSNPDQNMKLSRLYPSFEPERSNGVTPEMLNLSAYYKVTSKLRSLLMEHEHAKFVVTGHSLGGALAILFPTVLVLHKEMKIMDRLLGVYTFGQPRVGNSQLGQFMEAHLVCPVPRYFRVVYCNDLVSRLPNDDKTFLFKHFGNCLYYDSLFTEYAIDEEPNKNYFGLRYLIPEYLIAWWELIRSLLMGYTHGPEYKEGWFTTLLRVIGLAVPGISAHCPVNYVNSVRLGRKQKQCM